MIMVFIIVIKQNMPKEEITEEIEQIPKFKSPKLPDKIRIQNMKNIIKHLKNNKPDS